jgi:hypothetical protein
MDEAASPRSAMSDAPRGAGESFGPFNSLAPSLPRRPILKLGWRMAAETVPAGATEQTSN